MNVFKNFIKQYFLKRSSFWVLILVLNVSNFPAYSISENNRSLIGHIEPKSENNNKSKKSNKKGKKKSKKKTKSNMDKQAAQKSAKKKGYVNVNKTIKHTKRS